MALPIQRPAGINRFLQSNDGSTEYTDSLDSISTQLESAQLTVTQLVCLKDPRTSCTHKPSLQDIPIMH